MPSRSIFTSTGFSFSFLSFSLSLSLVLSLSGLAVLLSSFFVVSQLIQIDNGVHVVCVLVIGQPLAVRRPGIIRNLAVGRVINLNRILIADIRVPQVEVFIRPSDFLAVRRP